MSIERSATTFEMDALRKMPEDRQLRMEKLPPAASGLRPRQLTIISRFDAPSS